ncbi:MAG TPA: MAPEG family protein [Thermoanaerobaculia bacterium]|nr:MAPEG family protein [Thermoanaerobaculia bacterium]
MELLGFDEPLFATYAIAASLVILKYLGHGWLTVWAMLSRKGGFLNPEDANRGAANPAPRPGQLDPDDLVERTRRMHRNDMENAPAFLVGGLLLVLTQPPLLVAQVLLYGYVATRFVHSLVYFTGRSHEVRATFYSIGSLIVIGMAITTLVRAII